MTLILLYLVIISIHFLFSLLTVDMDLDGRIQPDLSFYFYCTQHRTLHVLTVQNIAWHSAFPVLLSNLVILSSQPTSCTTHICINCLGFQVIFTALTSHCYPWYCLLCSPCCLTISHASDPKWDWDCHVSWWPFSNHGELVQTQVPSERCKGPPP